MIVEFIDIESLDEIDFDYMFTESYTRMVDTFLWPQNCDTFEKRKQYYYNQLLSADNGTWPVKNDNDTFILIATKVDGMIVEFTAGFRDENDIVSLRWHLTAPGADGKRNWRYSQEALQARKDFVAASGIAAFKEFTWKGSLHYRTLRMRAQTGNFTLEEVPNPNKYPGRELVEFIIRFP